MLGRTKAAYQAARVGRRVVESSLLGTIIGEIENKAKNGKNFGDAEILLIIKKMRESAVLTYGLTDSDSGKAVLLKEISILDGFLPQQLAEDELKCILTELRKTGPIELKDYMNHLREKHSGQYDGRLASSIFKDSM